MSSDQNTYNCYDKGVEAVLSGIKGVANLAKNICNTANTYKDRVKCFNVLVSRAKRAENKVVYGACSSLSREQNQSNCFTKGLDQVGVDTNIAQLLVNACNSANTYSDRLTCYKKGSETADQNGFFIGMYLRGCNAISNSTQAYQCYYNVLKDL